VFEVFRGEGEGREGCYDKDISPSMKRGTLRQVILMGFRTSVVVSYVLVSFFVSTRVILNHRSSNNPPVSAARIALFRLAIVGSVSFRFMQMPYIISQSAQHPLLEKGVKTYRVTGC
jgi:hypothetical protein